MNTLQLSSRTKNKCLNNVFQQQTLYAMIPTSVGTPQGTELPRSEITFNEANNGQISLAGVVQFTVQAGTTINRVYLHTSPLTNEVQIGDALMTINLDGDDIEVYDSNGVYIINTINVAINT